MVLYLPECLQITKTPKTQALAPSRSSPQSQAQAAKCLEDKDQDLQFNFFFFFLSSWNGEGCIHTKDKEITKAR